MRADTSGALILSEVSAEALAKVDSHGLSPRVRFDFLEKAASRFLLVTVRWHY